MSVRLPNEEWTEFHFAGNTWYSREDHFYDIKVGPHHNKGDEPLYEVIISEEDDRGFTEDDINVKNLPDLETAFRFVEKLLPLITAAKRGVLRDP